MAETMRATLDSIRERDVPEGDGAKPDRVRAPDGKFAKAEGEAPVVIPPVDALAAPAAVVAPTDGAVVDPAAAALAAAVAVPVATEPAIAAPSSWTGAAKAEFAKASPVIQQEVLRREQQMHNGIAQYKDAASYGQEIHKAIAPFNATIQKLGVTPAAAIEAMFKVDHTLRYGSPQEKLQHIADLARNYGVDLSQGVPEQAPIDPNYQHLQSQLQATQQQLQQITADRESQQQTALNSQIEAAKEGRPHFDNLRQEMAVLIQAAAANGENLLLPDAYDRAVWSHPTYRAEMLAQQQAERAAAEAKTRAEATAKATAAAAAAKAASSVNVPKRGTLQAQGAVGTMQDTMRETLEKIRSR
jgi:hypothetical protein